jgi:hypothetical protein
VIGLEQGDGVGGEVAGHWAGNGHGGLSGSGGVQL